MLILISFLLMSCTSQDSITNNKTYGSGVGVEGLSGYNEEQKHLLKIDQVVVIDVRDPKEVTDNPAVGSINVPLSHFKSQIQQIVPDKNKLILVFCEYGGRSARATAILKNLGYKNVIDIRSWRKWVQMNKEAP